MSLLSGVFTELEKVPAPRLAITGNVARIAAPAPTEMPSKLRASNQRPPMVEDSAEIPRNLGASSQRPQSVEDPDQPQHIINTAATASPEWIAVRDQYVSHLMACRACYAPTGRYCPDGADL